MQVDVADLLLEATTIEDGHVHSRKMQFLAALVQTLKAKAAAGRPEGGRDVDEAQYCVRIC